MCSLSDPPGLRRGEDRRRREHPVADPADLDDQRIGGDAPTTPSTDAITGAAASEALRFAASRRSARLGGERLADGPLVAASRRA